MRNISKLAIAAGAWFSLHSSASALVRVDVDLSAQRMHVSAGSGETYSWPISSGRFGHSTPHGLFHPQAMYVMVHSRKYNNAPMPHAIFFHGQYAIHGTNAVWALGHPASHGCIRLAPGNAAALFALVSHEGAQIRISGVSPADAAAANPHRAGHALAAAQRKRFRDAELGYAPRPKSRSLRQWLADPFSAY
jgi:hypothetical protein